MLDNLNNLDFSSYFDESRKATAPAIEHCRLSLRDGHELEGNLAFYDEQAAQLRLIPDGADAGQTYSLDQVRMLRLDRPVGLEANDEHFHTRNIAVHAIGKRAPFSLSFRDGHVFSGELLGYCFSPGGLGMYLADDGGQAIRCFVPEGAIQDFTMGLPIGRVLLDRGHLTEEGLNRALDNQRALRAQRVGEILAERQIIDRRALEAALDAQSRKPHLKIGQVLLEMGAINAEQLQQALDEQGLRRKKPLGEVLVDMGLLDSQTVKEALAEKLGVPHVMLERFHIERNAFESISAKVILENQVVPLYRTDDGMVVAMSNPFDARVINVLRFAAQSKIIPVLATRKEIEDFLDTHRPDAITIWQNKDEGEHVKGFS